MAIIQSLDNSIQGQLIEPGIQAYLKEQVALIQAQQQQMAKDVSIKVMDKMVSRGLVVPQNQQEVDVKIQQIQESIQNDMVVAASPQVQPNQIQTQSLAKTQLGVATPQQNTFGIGSLKASQTPLVSNSVNPNVAQNSFGINTSLLKPENTKIDDLLRSKGNTRR